MGISVTERVRLVFVRPTIHGLPEPDTDDMEELREYMRRNIDYETAQEAEPLVLAYKMLAELAKSGRLKDTVVRRYWRSDEGMIEWLEWPKGWRCGCSLEIELEGGVHSWFLVRGSYMCANRLAYEELEKTSWDVTDKLDGMAEMAKSLCCVVEHSESVECGDYDIPVWWMPDGSKVEDAKDLKSAVEDNIAQALLKRAAMGLDEQTRPDEP